MYTTKHVTWFSLVTAAVTSSAQEIFHGRSLILAPNLETGHPKDCQVQTSSFYCFMSPVGYLSFGWWLGSNSRHLDLSPVRPDPAPGGFDWYEFSNGTCGKPPCRFHARNFNAHKSKLAFEDDYVVEPFQLGHAEHSMMALSYFDRSGGASAVGVRTRLYNGTECEAAFATLKEIKSEHGLDLPFELVNPCGPDDTTRPLQQKETNRLQQLLGYDL